MTIKPGSIRKYQFWGEGLSLASPSERQAHVMETRVFTEAYAQEQKALLDALGLKDGMPIIDVGANIGYMSILYSMLYPNSPVVAIEPSSYNFGYIEHNCSYFDNILLVNEGCHPEVMEAELAMPTEEQYPRRTMMPDNTGLLSLHGSSPDRTETVSLRPLDDLLQQAEIDHPGFIKIDVEGHEIPVLKSSKGTLEGSEPGLQIEVNPRALAWADSSYRGIKSFLAGFGYEPYQAEDGDLKAIGTKEITEITDVFFRRGKS